MLLKAGGEQVLQFNFPCIECESQQLSKDCVIPLARLGLTVYPTKIMLT